jgi:agmatinase
MNEGLFLGHAAAEVIAGRPALLGCPLDVTSTYRSGSAEAPRAVRSASESIETYSPFLDLDLEDLPFADLGDIHFPSEPMASRLERIRNQAREVIRQGGFPLCIGGEHTITLPAVQAVGELFPDVMIIHVDAHADLRTDYEGNLINHATVMRRVGEAVGPERLVQLGIRSGTREEFSWMKENGTLFQWGPSAQKALSARIGARPVYLTVDLDVMDPACVPGTGNPEPGGWFFQDMERLIHAMRGMNLVAADVVELNPSLDLSGASTITAARIVRELLLILGG